MASISETGHAKNVANFNTLISFVRGYGESYKPSRESIKLPSLLAKATEAQTTIDAVNAGLPSLNNAIAARDVAFAPLSKLGTRMVNALKATETATQVIDNLVTLNRKLQGGRASTILTEQEKAARSVVGKETKQISASQQSFDSRLDQLDKIVQLLVSIPFYKPNETELKTATLTALYTSLKEANASVVSNTTMLSNARLNRDKVMYHAETGLTATALDVKSYVKSLYGISSPNYQQISALPFKTITI